MFVNLHNLPAGKSLYTVYVSLDPVDTPRDETFADEVDVVATSGAYWRDVINNGEAHSYHTPASTYIVEMYGQDSRIVGVVDQSAGVIIYDSFVDGNQ
jgi:hypothetical protein